MNRSFSEQIASAQNQLHALLNQLNHPTSGEREVAERAVEALSQSLEELHVAQEELHQQNAELLATRRALAAERQRYQELFAFAPDGYLVTDANGIIQKANRAAARQVGVREDHLEGKPLAVFVSSDEQADFYALINQLRRMAPSTSSPVQDTSFEILMQPRDSNPFPASITVAPVRDEQASLTAIRWLVRDITARKNAYVQLEAALEQKDILLREVHHRVKNSLSIAGSLLELQAMEYEDETIKAVLSKSNLRLQAIARVHEQLYQTEDLRAIDMHSYLTTLITSIHASLGRPDVNLRVTTDPISLDLKTASPCGLITNELVTNAIKHAFPKTASKNGGTQTQEIHVSFRHKWDTFHLVVSDNGIGLNTDITAITAMGTNLVRLLAKSLNGTFEARPTPNMPSGATFEVIFPYPESPTP